MSRRRAPLVRVVTAVLVAATGSAACASDAAVEDSSDADDASETSTDAGGAPAAARGPLELRPLRVSSGRIVDDLGRSVLLRGANVNSLGDYHRGDPERAPTAPVTDDDWDAMAAHGLSVVRLIISWSSLEPVRGTVDRNYLARVRDAVEAANARGMYVVLDMHQDAWGREIATPDGTVCPDGTEAAIGWDGAPRWATLTDGESTCRPGSRESAPAVQAAFRNFYANTDGIRDRLVAVWGEVAAEFAGVSGVAGYEFLNEPNPVAPAAASIAGYNQFIADAIAAVRAAERAAGAEPALVFAEPLVSFPLPDSRLDPAVVSDPDLVFAPHNYAESIGPKVLTVEQTWEIDVTGAADLGAPGPPAALWIGEYGWWNTEADTLAVARRYAAAEDAAAAGGAWWQWRQTCGDPHAVGRPGGRATHDQIQLVIRSCPEDVDAGLNEAFLAVLGRSYPRAAPGRIDELISDPDGGGLRVTASAAPVGAEVVVWLSEAADRLSVDETLTSGLGDVTLTDFGEGRLLTAVTDAAAWTLVVA